jgi:hypothetical protein
VRKNFKKTLEEIVVFYWTYHVFNMPFGLKTFSVFLDRAYIDYSSLLPVNKATISDQAKMQDVILAK